MRSRAGLDYRLFIYTPASPAPPHGYPVIYVLDGNAWFEPMASAMRLQASSAKLSGISPAVIVAIAYPGDVPFNVRRFYDFIPDVPLVEKVPPGMTPPKIGGGEQFLTFLREEVEPAIAQRRKIDSTRRTLFGHSLGCSFTLHVLFTHTEEFDTYVCGSPSLYFNDAYILTEADKFMARLQKQSVHANLLLYVAEYDQKVPPTLAPEMAKKIGEQLAQARVVTGGRELANQLASYGKQGLQTSFMEIQGENHISEVPVIINRMLPVVLKPQGDD